MATKKFVLRVDNTMLQSTRVREFVNLSEAVDCAEWIVRDNTPAGAASARLIANALRVEGVTVRFAQYSLAIAQQVI